MRRRKLDSLITLIAVAALGACAGDIAGVPETPELLSVVPAGGTTDVDPNEPITIQFSHPMGIGMEQYVVLHEGDINGQIVPGTWIWSDDRTTVTFTPDEPLKSQTQYTVHVGGGLSDGAGQLLNCQRGEQFGGQWVSGGMMGGMGGMGSMSGSMMGQGWRHPDNDTYGMIFTFTTA